MNNIPNKPRKKWIAFFLGLLMPGLGQIYNGNLKEGALLFLLYEAIVGLLYVAWAYLLPSFVLLLILLLGALIAYLRIAVLAFRQCSQTDRQIPLQWYSKPYGLVGILLLWSLVVGPLYTSTMRYFVQAFKIPAASMNPTLLIGDHIVIQKAYYGIRLPFTDQVIIYLRSPHRGDIIVFKYPADESKDFIKGVIGEPGDVVEVRDKVVYVNHQVLVEPYTIPPGPDDLSVRGPVAA